MPVEATLLVGHGSRDAGGNAEFLGLVEQARRAFHGTITQACFIELAEPSVPEGLDRCVALGARRVVVLPIVLFAAGHAKVEIPHEMDEGRRRHPDVEFRYGRPFGIHARLFDILDERLAEADAALPSGPRAETAVLLIGRGSSDPDANGDLYKIARLLWEGRGYAGVEACFIGITRPDFAEGLARCRALGARRIVILPYFLFTGVLVRRIQEYAREFQARWPETPLHLAGHLGAHPSLLEILGERRREALDGTALMNCAMCKYRIPLAGQEGVHPLGAMAGSELQTTRSP